MDDKLVSVVQANFHTVQGEIQKAALRVKRDPSLIRLVVVTKTHPIEVVQAAVEAGVRYFGENYADEAIPKILAMKTNPELKWHMIGHIQSRKTKLVCQFFDYVHSLDSLRLAERLNNQAAELSRKIPVLLECNLGGEETKYGWPIWNKHQWNDLLPEMGKIVELPNLRVCGLMGMPPWFPKAEQSRPYYQLLYQYAIFLRNQFPQVDWSELSMGMSNDFEVAIEEGATWVRIGTRILGPRKNSGV